MRERKRNRMLMWNYQWKWMLDYRFNSACCFTYDKKTWSQSDVWSFINDFRTYFLLFLSWRYVWAISFHNWSCFQIRPISSFVYLVICLIFSSRTIMKYLTDSRWYLVEDLGDNSSSFLAMFIYSWILFLVIFSFLKILISESICLVSLLVLL